MAELGGLENKKKEFAKRAVDILAISVDGLEDSAAVQELFPSIKIISDESMSMANAFGLVHKGAGPNGEDIAVPTTFVLDGTGAIKFVYRSPAVPERQSAEELLESIDNSL